MVVAILAVEWKKKNCLVVVAESIEDEIKAPDESGIRSSPTEAS
jgi:hypothetical protein